MKNNISVFKLNIHSKLKKILIVYSLLAILTIGFTFFIGFNSIYCRILFLISYIGCFSCCVYVYKNNMNKYTLWRLNISERRIFFIDCFVNILYFLLLYLIEICIIYISLKIYISRNDVFGLQGLFMFTYEDSFVHSLIPLSDYSILIRNIFYILCSGCICSVHDVSTRNGESLFYSLLYGVVIGLYVTTFVAGLFEQIYFLEILSVVLGIAVFIKGIFSTRGKA